MMVRLARLEKFQIQNVGHSVCFKLDQAILKS